MALQDTLTALEALNLQNLRSELDTLEAIRDWAMDQIGVDYKVGDRVTITDAAPSEVDRTNGWYAYREALAPGQGGTVADIIFNRHSKQWVTCVAMDRTWSVHEHGYGLGAKTIRYWNGPASETPDGYEPPSKYNQERHPDGKVKHFYMRATYLAKATA